MLLLQLLPALSQAPGLSGKLVQLRLGAAEEWCVSSRGQSQPALRQLCRASAIRVRGTFGNWIRQAEEGYLGQSQGPESWAGSVTGQDRQCCWPFGACQKWEREQALLLALGPELAQTPSHFELLRQLGEV